MPNDSTINAFNFNDALAEHMTQHGAFYAFSTEQFTSKALRCIKYANAGAGLVLPAVNAKSFFDGLAKLVQKKISTRKELYTMEQIIQDELHNHEAWYTYSIDDTIEALDGYGYSRSDIQAVFDKYADKF